jgi:hypothetical protein
MRFVALFIAPPGLIPVREFEARAASLGLRRGILHFFDVFNRQSDE